jgi:hypothetical protein
MMAGSAFYWLRWRKRQARLYSRELPKRQATLSIWRE